MSDFFADLLLIVTPIFAVSSMTLVGLGNRPKDVVTPLRDLRFVAVALFASFVFVPLFAWAVSRLFSLDDPFEAGLMLVATAAGAPFVVAFMRIAGGNLALTAAVLVLQLVVTVNYMPIVLPIALGDDVDVDAPAIALNLSWTMLAPLVVGLIIRSWSARRSERLMPFFAPVATTSLVLVVVSTVLANLEDILDIFGEGAILAALLVIVAAFLSGYLLGGRDPELRLVLGFATSQRNVAAAMVVATQGFSDDPDVILMVVVTSLVSLAILFPLAFAFRSGEEAEVDMALREIERRRGVVRGAGRRPFRLRRAQRKE